MDGLRILALDTARGRDLPWPDIYFTPAYGRCVERAEQARWEVAVWEPGPILYPYLVRPIPTELVSSGVPTESFDIIAPYGYAGPWAHEGTDAAEWTRFRRALRDELRQRGGVAEFVRFHPLLRGRELACRADSQLESIHCGSTVSVDLRAGYEGASKRYEERQRSAVRKAQKAGYSVRVRTIENTDAPARARFRMLHSTTMQSARARYHQFGDAYFEALWSELGSQTLLGEVVSCQGETVAAALFFTHGDMLHYHLAGSNEEHARQGADNLLLDAMVAWGATRGRRILHLGGGLSHGDSLYKFKAAIGRDRHEFWIGRSVLDAPLYKRLVQRAAELRGRRVAELVGSGYFPAYRTPAETTPAEARTV